jgi:hypothetical protein
MKIKEEYKNYSIGGGNLRTIRLADLDPSLYKKYADAGWSEFFEIPVVKKSEKKNIKEDDTNSKGTNEGSLFDTDGEDNSI